MSERLTLKPAQPIAVQRDFFSPNVETPTLPIEARKRGAELSSFRRFDLGIASAAVAASILGIAEAELLEAESGAFEFDLVEAKRILRAGRT